MGYQRPRLVSGTACKEIEKTFWVGNVLSIDYDVFYIVCVFSKTHWTVYFGCRKFITWKLYLSKVVWRLSIEKSEFWSVTLEFTFMQIPAIMQIAVYEISTLFINSK